MADFEPPSGPPPPKVPEGWVARWNDQYKEWFYVNTLTKKSQWDKPTAPARPAAGHDDLLSADAPPSYTPGARGTSPSDAKRNPYDDDDGNVGGSGSKLSRAAQEEEDARLARQLQAEEDARARSTSPGGGRRGAAASYPDTPLPPGAGEESFPDQLPPRDGGDKQRGLLGKIFGRKNNAGTYGQQQAYPGGGYGGGGYGGGQPPYGSQGGYYGGASPGYGGGYAAPGYPPPGGGYYGGGGYPPQQQSGGRFGRSGGGLGGAGGLALGAGAGLLGGMVLGDVIADHNQMEYQQGYDQGQMADDGGGDGGDGGGGGDFGDGGGGGDF